MYERILVPTDGSETVDAVLDAALDLAERDGATVHLLYVADTTRPSLTATTTGAEDVLEREGETIVSTVAERVRERGLEVVAEVKHGRPASTIVEYANAADVDVVVMPTHGRTGVARLFLGSITERVVRQSDVPVLTIRPDSTATIPVETVLVPTDGSAAAATALEEAIQVALDHDASLDLLHVIDTASLGPDVGSYVDIERLEANAETILAEAVDTASAAGVEDVNQTIEYGTPHREIRRFVEDNDVHLVVMGTQGLTGFDRYLLGSVAEKVLRTAPVPVMTVHSPDEE